MSMLIIGGIAALVLVGEPLIRLLWANRGKLPALHRQPQIARQFSVDESPNVEVTEAERRERAFRSIEEVVAYFDDIGDAEGAEEARAAGRLLFGKPSEPTKPNGKG